MTDEPQTRDERAAAGEHEIETELEMFPSGSLAGDGPTPQNIVRKGLPVELKASLSKAGVPLRGGLLDPNEFGRALVTYLPGKLHEQPIRDDKNDDAKVTGWRLIQDLRVTYVEAASDHAGLIIKLYEELQAGSPSEAAKVLDDLGALTAESLRAA